jgi:iron complex transport system permease protein
VVAGFVFYGWMGNKADILSLGDEEARSLGVNAGLLRILFIVGATFMTAIVVASAGIIPWVGLLIPHALRFWLGPENRTVIPASAFCGGIYLVVADTIARAGTSFEIPVGIVTSLLGAPFLLLILRKSLKKIRNGV